MSGIFRGEKLYTVGEVADALRVSRATVVRAIQKGKLSAFRVEGQWRILHSEVMRYLSKEPSETSK